MKKAEYINIITRISEVMESLNLQKILKTICDIVVKHLNYKTVLITITTPCKEGNKIKTFGCSDDYIKNEFYSENITSFLNIINQILREDKKQIVDLSKYKGYESILKDSPLQGCRFLSVYPLIIKNKTIGSMSVFGIKKDDFTKEKSGMLYFLASQLAIAIENSRLFEEILVTVEKHEKIKEQLIHTEKLGMIGQLISSIAHELNNPLTSIVGYSQLVLRENINGLLKDDIEKIYSEAQRAKEIVQNLLRFTRQYKPEKIPTDINSLIMEVISLRKYELEVNNIKVDCDLCKNLPNVEVVPNKIKQVLLNILVNAEQAIQESKKEQGNIIITTKLSGSQIIIAISDDGIGIPKSNIEKIFNPFFTTKKSDTSTGLGLAVSYEIIKEHKGDIEVVSEEKRRQLS